MDLGVLLYQLGEVWWALLPHLATESTHPETDLKKRGLQALRVRLKAFYKEAKEQSKLKVRKVTLIKGKGPPRLKAKAGQARALVAFTTELAREFSGADGALGMHRFQCMETLSGICELGKRDILTRDDLVRWRRLAAEHMFHYASAGFDAKPKFHYSQHLPQQVERGGVPRSF